MGAYDTTQSKFITSLSSVQCSAVWLGATSGHSDHLLPSQLSSSSPQSGAAPPPGATGSDASFHCNFLSGVTFAVAAAQPDGGSSTQSQPHPTSVPDSNGADTDTAGDDQPTRWQLLVRRVNADVAAAAGGLSPCKSARSPDGPHHPRETAPISPVGPSVYGSPGVRRERSPVPATVMSTTALAVEPQRDQYDRAASLSYSPSNQAQIPGRRQAWAHSDVRDSVSGRRPAPAPALTAVGGDAAATARRSGGGLHRRQLMSGTPANANAAAGALTSPYERAVAALQQAELQLRNHKQRGGGGGAAALPSASPASAAVAAAERFLATAPAAAAAPRPGGMYGGASAPGSAGSVTAAESTFDEIAQGLVRRIASSVRLGLGLPGAAMAPPGPLVHSYTVLEPPPAQHVAAAAALAAATAAAGGGGGGGAAGACGATDGGDSGAPELELQIAMQGLMAAARHASSEESLRADQERRRREAEAEAEAAMAAVEERAVQLARAVLYLRLWRVGAAWSRREAAGLAAGLTEARLRRYVAAWRAVARAARSERLAAEALELAAEARREQVANRFRRLWLLHHSLLVWRAGAAASAEERRGLAVREQQLGRERQAEALREAAAERFRRLWLLHSHLRTWRAAARARAAARRLAGGGTGAVAGGRGGCGGGSAAASAGSDEQRQQQQRRTAAVAALLDRLRRQREEFRAPAAPPTNTTATSGGSSSGGGGGGGGGVSLDQRGKAPGTTGPAAVLPVVAAATAAPSSSATSAAAVGRPFPGLNKWIRPEVMRGTRTSSSSAAAAAAGGPTVPAQPSAGPGGGGGGSRVTRPVPFQLSTSARARYRRVQVLAACEATRHLVVPAEPPTHGSAGAEQRVVGSTDPRVGRSGDPLSDAWAVAPGFSYQNDADGGGGDGGDAGVGGQGSEAALHALRQVVRRRHQERVGQSSGSGASGGSCGGADAGGGSLADPWVGAAAGEGGAVPAAGRRAGRGCGRGSDAGVGVEEGVGAGVMFQPLLASSSPVSSVWSERGAETAPGGAIVGGKEEEEEEEGRVYRSAADDAAAAAIRAVSSAAGRVAAAAARVSRQVGPQQQQQQQQQQPPEEEEEEEWRGGQSEVSGSDSEQQQQQQQKQRRSGPGPAAVTSATGAAATAMTTAAAAVSVGRRVASASPQPPPAADPRAPTPTPLPHLEGGPSSQQSGRRGRPSPDLAPDRSGRPHTGSSPIPPAATPAAAAHCRPAAAAATHVAGGRGGGGGGGGGFTAADLERLRAAEVRRRRQADEQARRLASELAAQQEALAAVHYGRALLKWQGLTPWLQLVALARAGGERAERHRTTALMRRTFTGLLRGAVRARMRAVSRVAAAVAVGRRRYAERVARAALARLRAWARAAALHRHHLTTRVLMGLMRAAAAGWSARADAEEHCRRRRLWSCFQGWRQAAERQASEALLWELQRQHEAEAALGRRTARRVLAQWRLLAGEAAEQRAALQQRSAQWAKVQGWLAEVAAERAAGRRGGGGSAGGAGAGGGGGVQRLEGRWDVGQDHPDSLPRPGSGSGCSASAASGDVAAAAAADSTGIGGTERSAATAAAGRRSGGVAVDSGSRTFADDHYPLLHRDNDEDDPLGLGPLEEQLQQFSLGPSGLAKMAPGALGCGGGGGGGPRPPRDRIHAWPTVAGAGPAAVAPGWTPVTGPAAAATTTTAAIGALSEAGCESSSRWAVRREGVAAGVPGEGHRPAGRPPVCASRRDRLARYLEGREAPGGGGGGGGGGWDGEERRFRQD
ncbi:hypothetical protein PLESTM_000248600 [Pleodorina starrii]|nr:hypothetical protein PLESTM_000248600 [Pleodorina starrii]